MSSPHTIRIRVSLPEAEITEKIKITYPSFLLQSYHHELTVVKAHSKCKQNDSETSWVADFEIWLSFSLSHFWFNLGPNDSRHSLNCRYVSFYSFLASNNYFLASKRMTGQCETSLDHTSSHYPSLLQTWCEAFCSGKEVEEVEEGCPKTGGRWEPHYL